MTDQVYDIGRDEDGSIEGGVMIERLRGEWIEVVDVSMWINSEGFGLSAYLTERHHVREPTLVLLEEPAELSDEELARCRQAFAEAGGLQ